MIELTGIWRLVTSKAWDEAGNALAEPYGKDPLGQITFTAGGRMLAALCSNDGTRYTSYGGTFVVEGSTLTTTVDMASDTARIGGQEARTVTLNGDVLTLRPPMRRYDGVMQQRELRWERAWHPTGGST